MSITTAIIVRTALLASLWTLLASTVFADDPRPRFKFSRLVAGWAHYDLPLYFEFVEQAQSEVAQHGFDVGHFWSLAHTAHCQGYPPRLCEQGLLICTTVRIGTSSRDASKYIRFTSDSNEGREG